MVMMMMIGTLEYISGQRHWFDGMMMSDHEGLWVMKPSPSQGNKVIFHYYQYPIICTVLHSNHSVQSCSQCIRPTTLKLVTMEMYVSV